jgi:hypothetical protein
LSHAYDSISRAESGRFRDDKIGVESRLQPWKVVWPLKGTASVDLWSKSEFPEVAYWSFDSRHPFDRPWRTWTRSALARSEKSHVACEEELCEEMGKFWNGFLRFSVLISRLECILHDEAPQTRYTGYLDTEIYSRQMRISEPTVFNYLAPLKKYHVEKPYLSRLPFLPGFARTNIVGQSRSIPFHEVSGNEDLFTLDMSGFEFAHFPILLDEWTDAAIQATYIPALKRWLKRQLNCSETHVYAYNVSPTEDSLLVQKY